MKKRIVLYLLVSIIASAMVASSSQMAIAAHKPPAAKKIALTCGPKTITAGNSVSSQLVVNSRCWFIKKAKGKKPRQVLVPSKVDSITYQPYDAPSSTTPMGNSCGGSVTAINRGYFKVSTLGAYRVVVLKVVAGPRNTRLYKAVQAKFKSVSVVLKPVPGYEAVCASPANTPIEPPSVLCSQTNPNVSSVIGCGVSVPGGCVWSSLPTKQSLTIAATDPVCSDGDCWTVPLARAAATSTWLGATMPAGTLQCSNGSGAEFLLEQVTLTGPAGTSSASETCGPYSPLNANIMSFTVPSDWGGTISVLWEVESHGPNGAGLGAELVGASFTLNGSQDGCSQLESDPNSISA